MPRQRPSLVLITRPEDAARSLRQDLERRGYGTIIEPLLTIEPVASASPVLDDVQAIALTSAHAVFALSEAAKALPVFTVGPATAEAALKAGCTQLIPSDGDAKALAGMIVSRCRPEDGAILHLAGEVVREDLHRILTDRGFACRRQIVYRAVASTSLSDDLIETWRRREIAAVLLFSPRTAAIFVQLLIDHDLSAHVDTVTALCLSENTAAPCRALGWKGIVLAAQPNQGALIRALEGSIGIC